MKIACHICIVYTRGHRPQYTNTIKRKSTRDKKVKYITVYDLLILKVRGGIPPLSPKYIRKEALHMPENYMQSIVIRIRRNKRMIKLYNRIEKVLLVMTHLIWVMIFASYIISNTDAEADVVGKGIMISVISFLGVVTIAHMVFCFLRGLRILELRKLRERRRNA